jgi:hypothetical protein
MWPEEELEELVCDVACAIATVILRVKELIVVTPSEDPVNLLTNPNPLVTQTRDNFYPYKEISATVATMNTVGFTKQQFVFTHYTQFYSTISCSNIVARAELYCLTSPFELHSLLRR